MAYYNLKRSGSQYMFNLCGDNHETVLTSERYVTKQGAQNGITSVRQNSPYDTQYRRLTATNGLPYFVLKAGNSETIGTSEQYANTTNRDGAIEWVKLNAPGAPTHDNC